MEPLDFLQTCERLASNSPSQESDNRTILSRLYYAFFLALRDGIAAKDAGFRANLKHLGSDHALVRNYLRGVRFTPSGDRTLSGRRVPWYERYDAVFHYREIADYEMTTSQDEISNMVEELMAEMPVIRDHVQSLVR